MPHQELYWRNYSADRFAIRTPDSKLIFEVDKDYLFDIQKDISEKVNLAASQTKRLEELKQTLETWRKSIMDPIFMGLMQDKEYSKLNPDRFNK